MARANGFHFLQIPGPTNVPDRILRAMAAPTMDHRGPAFQELGRHVLQVVKPIFGTKSHVVIFPSSGTGAWEAALVNTLSPGDTVVMAETGHFSSLWTEMAKRLGLDVRVLPGDWRRGAQPEAIAAALDADKERRIKAVCVVHNETSTGVASRVGEIRKAIDATGHPALFMVDTISSLASIDYRQDEWKVDVTVAGSQKGLMLPPGISFNGISEKALAAHKASKMPRAFWDWTTQIKSNADGMFPYTPATNLLYGLKEACAMLMDEGMANVFARHQRHGAAARKAVAAWGLETVCQDAREHSGSLTAVWLPEGVNADKLRALILDKFDMSLGNGLSKLAGRAFRIGHLGAFSDLQLMGTLAGVEMGLKLFGVKLKASGIEAALESLAAAASERGAVRHAAE